MLLAKIYLGLHEGKEDVKFFVDKAFSKGMNDLSDIELKNWLDVKELSKKEQSQAFKLIRKG